MDRRFSLVHRTGRARCTIAVVLAAALLGWAGAATAAQTLPSGPDHRGIVEYGPYQVFPERRPGNAVYLENRLVFSTPPEAILTVRPLPVDGRFAYLAREPDGTMRLGVYLPDSDPEPRINRVAEGFYHVVMSIDGVVYKKAYRVLDSGQLVDLLPFSKTADGMTPGPGGVVFYHVATANEVERDGETVTVFGVRLHLARYDEERLLDLDYLVSDRLPRLELSWQDDTRIEYELADGTKEVLSVSQFQ